MKLLAVLFFLVFFYSSLYADDNIPKDTLKDKSIIGLPVVYFSPETNWAFGLGAIYTFHIKKENRPSSLQTGLIYTLRKQYLFYLPFQLFWDDTKNDINGEFGFYKYNYQYFGIGNRSKNLKGEVYDVTYPRIQMRVLRKFATNWYVGLDYAMDKYNVTKIVDDGILDTENSVGKIGGLTSIIGVQFKFDSRDNLFYSTQGYFFKSFLVTNPKILGSPFKFSKLGIDFRFFKKNRYNHILGFQFLSEITMGTKIPFFQMSELGGNKMMRGYIEGEYRDKIFLGFQSEYRFPLIWRLGMVAFGGVGVVTDQFSNLRTDYLKYSIGTGLRILLNKKEHINMRIDVAFASESWKPRFYITFAESF